MRDGTRTRARIETEALRLFATKGIDATSVRDIAGAVGVAEGALYRHFPGKGTLSRTLFLDSSPGAEWAANNNSLGIEINGGARYETEDGFYGQLQYGILFPLEGFSKGGTNSVTGATNLQKINLENPQALRAVVGIKF